jgi:hypothetical protein
MKKYRVFLQGKNCLLNIDDKTEKTGFYTTRFVEANDELEAENKSVELIRNDPQLRQSVLNEKGDPPIIYLEDIEEISDFDGINTPGAGYTFYPDDADE